jgi:hypothetical protein
MPKPTFPSVSVVFCFLSHAGRRKKTTETDGNVGFDMGKETENDRD